MAKEYKQQTQIECAERVDEVLQQLPGFCKTYFAGKRQISKTTALLYAHDLHEFFVFLARNNSYFKNRISCSASDGYVLISENTITLSDMENITSDDIDEFASYLEKKGNSKETVEHYLSALSSMWKFFVKRQQLKYNPVDAVERLKQTKKKVVRLSTDEKYEFLSAVESGEGLSKKQLQYHNRNKERDYAIYKLFLSTGIRVSELAGIDIDDIDFKKKSVNIVRKGGDEQQVFFSDSCFDALVSYLNVRSSVFKPLDEERALFVGPFGKRLSVRAIQNLTKKYVATSLPGKNEKITTHKLRSTYATEVLEKTGNIKLVSELLGHKQVTTAEKYAEYLNGEHESIRNITE